MARLWVHGGYGAQGSDNSGAPSSSLWAFQAGQWLEVTSKGAPWPARARHALAWDPSSGSLLLYGGETLSDGQKDTTGNVWKFQPNQASWTELSTSGQVPGSLVDHEMEVDVLSGSLVVVSASQVYTLGLETLLWTELPPISQDAELLFLEPASSHVLLATKAGASLSAKWTDLSAGTTTLWEISGESPPQWAASAYDPIGGIGVTFGGLDVQGYAINRTYQLLFECP